MIIEVDNRHYCVISSTKVSQPIGDFYTSVIDWQILRDIVYVDERILVGFDDENKEVYRGIQRKLSASRQQEIKNYISNNPNATFPSSILINIPYELVEIVKLNNIAEFDLNSKSEWSMAVPFDSIARQLLANQYCLIFPIEKGVAQIIDGQHRMSGFTDETDQNLIFELPITVFIDQIPEEQAEIFAIINGKQTRVAPSLVYELFGLSKARTPFSVVHSISKLLNESPDSPLYHWIRRLGRSNELYKGYLTQSTVVKNLLDLISGNIKQAEHDKNNLLNGVKIDAEMKHTRRSAPLRKYFIDGEDEIIYKILLNYFKAIRDTQTSDWEDESSVLRKTIGFMGLIKIAKELIPIGQQQNNLTYDFFYNRFIRVKPKLKSTEIQLSSLGVNQVYEFYKEVLN